MLGIAVIDNVPGSIGLATASIELLIGLVGGVAGRIFKIGWDEETAQIMRAGLPGWSKPGDTPMSTLLQHGQARLPRIRVPVLSCRASRRHELDFGRAQRSG